MRLHLGRSWSFLTAVALCLSGSLPVDAQPRQLPIARRGPAHFADHTANLPNEPVTAIAVDPFDDQVIYAGLDGAVFRSDDSGATWVPILSFPRGLADDGALNDTAVDAFDSASNGQGITDALDDGVGTGFSAVQDPADPLPDGSEDDLPVGDFLGPDRSSDDPVDSVDTTVPPRVDPGVRAFAFVPASRGVLLVATPRGIYRTTNGGATFEQLGVPGGTRENDIRDLVVDPQRPTRLWIGTGGGLFVSPDGGATMERAAGRPGTVPITDIAIDEVDAQTPAHLLIGTERGLLRSRDGGESFADLLIRGGVAFPVVHSVAWDRGSDTVFAGTGDGLSVAVRGAAILERYSGMPDSPPSVISPDPLWSGGVAVGVRGAEGGVLFSDDNGITTIDVDVLPANAPSAIAREKGDPTRIWVACERGVYRLEPGTGIRVSRDAMTALRARFAREPGLDVVTERALRVHGYDPDDGNARGRASIAAWLPRINMQYEIYNGDRNQQQTTVLFRDPTTLPPFVDPTQDNVDLFGDGLLVVSPSTAVQQNFYINLVWDLDRLVFNSDVIRSVRQVPLMRIAERRLVDKTRQLYVARRRLVAEMMTDVGTVSPREQVNRELRLLELEAQLAGLVDEDLFSRTHSSTIEEAP